MFCAFCLGHSECCDVVQVDRPPKMKSDLSYVLRSTAAQN